MIINNTEKIMMIDRDVDFLTQAKKIIEDENENIEVLITNSIEKSLDVLEEQNFQVIISSYDIGEEEGLELLREVRKERRLNIPFILLMDRGDSRKMLKALKLDANRVFHKKKNVELSCQILSEIVKQEFWNHKKIKELKHHRKKESNKMRWS